MERIANGFQKALCKDLGAVQMDLVKMDLVLKNKCEEKGHL